MVLPDIHFDVIPAPVVPIGELSRATLPVDHLFPASIHTMHTFTAVVSFVAVDGITDILHKFNAGIRRGQGTYRYGFRIGLWRICRRWTGTRCRRSEERRVGGERR